MDQAEHSSNYTPELLERIDELKLLRWQDIERAAEAVDIKEKPADESWKAQADKIAVEEFRRANKSIFVAQPLIDVADSGDAAEFKLLDDSEDDTLIELNDVIDTPNLDARIETAERYARNGLPVCPACGELRQTGFNKRPICAIASDDCPYLQES